MNRRHTGEMSLPTYFILASIRILHFECARVDLTASNGMKTIALKFVVHETLAHVNFAVRKQQRRCSTINLVLDV